MIFVTLIREMSKGTLKLRFFLIAFVVCLQWPVPAVSRESGKDMEHIVITAADIKKRNVRTIVELLNQLPGITAGESSVGIRGSYKVRVMLDGRRINDPLSGYQAPQWELVELENVECIEIHRGGGAVLYGDDSSGGVITIRTRRIAGGRGSIEAARGQYDTWDFRLNYQRPLDLFAGSGHSLPLGVGVSARRYTHGGWRTNNDKDKQRLSGKISYAAGDNTFDLTADYAGEERGSPGLTAYPTPRARQDDQSFGTSLLCRIGAWKSGTHWSRSEKEHSNPDRQLLTQYESRSFKQDLLLPLDFKGFGDLKAGFNLEHGEVAGNRIASHQEQTYGAFAAKEFQFECLPVTLGLGLRYNYYSEFGHALSPEGKIGLSWNIFDFQLSATQTYNTPTFTQRYYESTQTRPNPDLNMENADNYRFTMAARPRPFIQAQCTLFNNRIKNRITYVRGDGGLGHYENFGGVVSKGAEISLKWKPCQGLEIRPSYMNLEVKDQNTGLWLASKPRHEMDLYIHYQPIPMLAFTWETHYESDQFTRSDNTESVPGYTTTDVKIDVFFKSTHIFVEIENLFDAVYDIGEGYPGTPFTWLVGVRRDF